MLSREYRLTQTRDFRRVYATGRGVSGPRLRLKSVANNLPRTRIGVVVANSVSKRATVRNQVKRWIREATRQLLPCLVSGVDVVVSAHPRAATAHWAEIQQELRWLCERAKLIQPK